MRILNLGCGSKASSSPDVVNIDWSIALRLKRNRLLRRLVLLETSLIPEWPGYGLEVDTEGHEFRPESMYLEVRK